MTTATKERGIMFSGPMVRAILEDRKTQTRRVTRRQPTDDVEKVRHLAFATWGWTTQVGYPSEDLHEQMNCPFGSVGDRLWVRETWRPKVCTKHAGAHSIPSAPCECGIAYAADYPDPKLSLFKWKSSMLMPRRACRIVLEITKIRVQRIQDIGSRDIVAEGVSDAHPMVEGRKCSYEKVRGRWRALWDSINADRGFGWKTNPWVWALTFKRIKP